MEFIARKSVDPKKKESPPHEIPAPKTPRVRMPDFVAAQLCRLVDRPPEGENWVHEAKFDGYRMQLRVERASATLRPRKGLDWSERFPEIVDEGRLLPDCLIDGEVCALKNEVPNFAALQQALSDGKTGALIFFIFDLLFFQGVDLREQPLSSRKDLLAALVKPHREIPHYRYVEHFATSGKKMLESACAAQLEGIVSKRIDAPYRSGRGDLWTKAKCRGGQEVVIGGWWGDAKKLRSILIGAWRGDDFVYQGRIGTGFNSENSGPLLRALLRLKRKTSPFTAGVKPPPAGEINWVEPKLVAEVEYATRTSDGLLRQAAFKALREDKPSRSVVVEKERDVREAEKLAEMEKTMSSSAAAKRRMTANHADNVVVGITISNPDKVLWPATKTTPAITKLELARYYEMAAPRMLPHIEGRPLSMVRAPDGILGERFFQRHVLAGVAGATPIKAKGEKNPFHAIDSVEGLVALAQAAVLEIHPWGCKKFDPETPERLIFDLDPDPEMAFDRVVESANEIREVLTTCGLTPFVKTTGGKGLHVVVAIKGTPKTPVTWPEAKAFALAFAETVARAARDRYTTNMSKKQRGGKIFLDYLRNDRTATAVGPWSPRTRPGSTIALPIPWKDVRKGLNAAEFTLLAAPALLKRPDPWKDLAASAASLEAAQKKLESIKT
jgi:bifunctional non-homologous end joining protein LigD